MNTARHINQTVFRIKTTEFSALSYSIEIAATGKRTRRSEMSHLDGSKPLVPQHL